MLMVPLRPSLPFPKGRAMNDMLLVNVLLPATCTAYDVWVPATLSAGEASRLIAAILSCHDRGHPDAVRSTALMSEDTGCFIDPNSTIGELGLAPGARLVLV